MTVTSSNLTPHAEIWNRCLAVIQDNIPQQSFNTWFTPIRPIKLEGKVLTIEVPSLFFYEWIEEHFVSLLKKTIRKELGANGKLEYSIVVDQSSGASSGSRTLNLPATDRPGFDDEIEVNLPENISDSIKNPFVIPGLKKVNIDPHLNSNLNFKNFVEGDCNRLARSAGQAVASKPGGTPFNPLYLYSQVGLGKTHLAQAIGNAVRDTYRNKAILYITSEKFTAKYVEAVRQTANRSNALSEFSRFFQQIDVLIVDDIQFLSGKKGTQDTFFHIFNHLHQNGKQIILTSDRPPKDLEDIEERLISRFKWGLSADLGYPDYETRLAIMETKVHLDGTVLPKEVMEFLASNISGNIRELEGALISLQAHSNLNKRDIDLVLAKEVTKSFVKSLDRELSVEEIQKIVCDHFDLSYDLIKAKIRKRHIVQARQLAMYFSKKMTKSSLAAIGQQFGGRDHSTVIHALKTVEDLMDTEHKFREKVNELEKLIAINLK